MFRAPLRQVVRRPVRASCSLGTLEPPPVRDKNGLSRLRTVTMNITESRTGSGTRAGSPDPGPAEIDSGPGHRS
jgi:hypothetical protein